MSNFSCECNFVSLRKTNEDECWMLDLTRNKSHTVKGRE